MTPGTGKFFPANNYHVHLFNDSYEFMNSENSNDTHFGDIVIRLRGWDDQQPPFQIMIDAADEIERLRAALHIAAGKLSTLPPFDEWHPETIYQALLEDGVEEVRGE